MKARIFLVLLFITFSDLSVASRRTFVGLAIKSVLQNYFEKQSSRVDMISFGEVGGSAQKLIQEILCNKPDSITLRVIKSGPLYINYTDSEFKLQTSSVLLFDSPQNFQENFKFIDPLTHPEKRHKHLVYFPNAVVEDIARSDNIQDGFSRDSIGFLVQENENSIDLASIFMFTEKKCREAQLTTISRFERSTMKWNNTDFYPNKYRNLFNCSLTISTKREVSESGLLPGSFVSYSAMIVRTLAEKINFVPDYQIFHISEAFTHSEIDLVQSFMLQGLSKVMSLSVIIDDQQATFVVPQGEPYTALERMYIMFDVEIWTAIILFLIVGLVTIIVVNQMSRKVQDFVYGRNIRTPTLNMLNIFLNGGQHVVPGRIFSRFLFMMFLIWCLIIRTCYQSMMFQYLQADMRKPEIATYEELVEKNFTFLKTRSRYTGAHFIWEMLERYKIYVCS